MSDVQEVKEQKKKEKDKSAELKEWIKDIAAAIIIAVLVLQFVMPVIVREHSMENSFFENDYVFVSKKAYTWFGKPQQGDVVVFKSNLLMENGQSKLLIKRIIGLPGDTVAIHGGMVYVNGQAYPEDYTKDGYTETEMNDVVVPEGTLFVMGDNRQNSADSRISSVGCVPMETVKGKVVIRIFPFGRFGLIK